MTDKIIDVPLANLAATLAELSTTNNANAWVMGTDHQQAHVELVPANTPGQRQRVEGWATTTGCADCTGDIGALAAHMNATHGNGIAHLVEDSAAWS